MRHAQIVEKVREIVGRHALPDFITGYDVRLGEFDGDPAMWIAFKTTASPTTWSAEAERRVAAITDIKRILLPELLAEFDDRYPYFRFESDPGLATAEL